MKAVCALWTVVFFGSLAMNASWADEPSPLVKDEERHLAVNEPDRFAWLLFERINQAVPNDDQRRVHWETWALASDVFAKPNTAPEWPKLQNEQRQTRELERIPLQQLIRLQEMRMRTGFAPRFDPQAAAGQFNETRLNRFTFDFVVKHELYNVEGQEAFFARGENLNFPLDAMEIKAQWRRIKAEDADIYHTAKTQNPDQLWGLTSLHITTKDLPNWFWATFEHKNNPEREAVVPSRDSHGLPASLKGTRWENYVLRGAQVNFVDSIGRSTILASSQIERGFQRSSSCITCHARATIGERPRDGTSVNRLEVFEGDDGSVGIPNPKWYVDLDRIPNAREYVQTDFVWSLFRAQRKSADGGSARGATGNADALKNPSEAIAKQTMRQAIEAAASKAPRGSAKFLREVEATLQSSRRKDISGRSLEPTIADTSVAAVQPSNPRQRAFGQSSIESELIHLSCLASEPNSALRVDGPSRHIHFRRTTLACQ